MQYVADLHLHSKYSRAVSQNMTLPVMAQVAAQKGLQILSACDFTHPLWLKEAQRLLEEKQEGIYVLKSEIRSTKSEKTSNDKKPVYFLFSTEIASIYTQNGKVRRIHNLVFAPNIETVEKINKELLKRRCNLSSDGRPIIGLSSKQLLSLLLEIDERCMLIPCHVWTPHFGIYGSASGFDSIEESFEELSSYIYGIETGLSSDPEMNWQVRELQTRSILSFSDAHSPAKMGREATVFDLKELSYENIRKAIMRKGKKLEDRNLKLEKESQASSFQSQPSNRIVYTIEFYPEEGKYHFSGHRNCGVSFGPEDIRTKGNTCPVCNRRLTEGVLFRVQQLADEQLLDRVQVKYNAQGLKWYVDTQHRQPPYVKLVPLLEIVAEAMEATVLSQKVQSQFAKLCQQLGSEIDILLKVPKEEIVHVAGEKIADAIDRVRRGTIEMIPGFDGEYGKVKIFGMAVVEKEEEPVEVTQPSLDI